jgi:hypothetical protein
MLKQVQHDVALTKTELLQHRFRVDLRHVKMVEFTGARSCLIGRAERKLMR